MIVKSALGGKPVRNGIIHTGRESHLDIIAAVMNS